MKNFTNNFKQFTSRLSARWLIMALMMLVGTSSAWAANKYTNNYIFLDLSGFTSWADGGAVMKVGMCTWDNLGNGHQMSTFEMTKVPGENYIYYADISSSLSTDRYGVKFSRHSSDGTEWDSFFSAYNSGNCGKPNDWKSGEIVNLQDVYCISAPTFGEEVEVGQSATSSGTYLYAGVSTIPEISNNSTEFQYVAGSSSITTNGLSTITVKFTPSSAGDKTGTLKFGSYLTTSLSGEGKVSCIPSATLSSAVYDAENNEIDLSGSIAPCGNELFYGFLWKNKNDANWNTANAISVTGGSNNKTTEDIDFNQSWDGFTPGDTYEFTAYALDATTNPYTWYYSTDENNVIEVSTCTSIPDNTYAIAGNNVWTGNANPVTINYDANTYGTPTILYDSEAQIPTDVGTYAITINVPAPNGYCASTISLGDYEITCIDVEKPAITTSATVCAGTQVTLSSYNGNNTNTVKWYSSQEFNSEVTEQVTLTDDGTKYYAKAYHEASGCYSSEYSTLTFAVNPLPNINISGSEEAVLYEDVELTAATDGTSISWEITEGDGSLSSTTGNSVTLTSSSAGTVTVTATATSAASCTSAATKTVTFSEEVCNNVADMTKIYFDATENTGFVTGSNVYVTITKSTNGSADCNDTGGANQGSYVPKNDTWWGTMTKVAGENYIYEITIPNNVTINKGTTKLSFWNNSISGNSDVWEVQAILGQTISAGTNCMKLSNKTKTHNDDRHSHLYCGTWTTYKNAPAITAPAAKTISVSTTDGEGNIIFSGQVVKTGCDATNEYGFQYSSDEQTWTTVKVGVNAAAGTAISNNTVNGLDGTYYVRAYITNDNSTQYGAVKAITVSTKKDPITKVTLTHVRNQAGESYSDQELENLTYCVGDIVWFKLEQNGSNFQDYEWISYPGTELTGMYDGGMFKLKITKSGNVGIRLRNDANVDGEGNPTWAESNLLEFNTHPEPTAPYISIDPASGVLCEGYTATITVTNPSTDCAYKLIEEGSKAGFTDYESGDLTYTVGSVGKYYVAAQHIACRANEYTSNQVEINQIISTSASISIDPANPETTPWEPVTITVNPQEGYVYELSYTDNNLAGVDGVIIKQNGDSYTYYIPRPNSWGTGNSNSRTTIGYGIKATLKVEGEATQCQMSEDTATITLKDEDNEDCN